MHKVITVSGKAGSGKTSFCEDIVRLSDCARHINLDVQCNFILDKKSRLKIYEESGIEELERILYTLLRVKVLDLINNNFYKIILIEGIKSDILFGDVADYNIEIKTDEETRLKQLKQREGSDDRAKFIESLST